MIFSVCLRQLLSIPTDDHCERMSGSCCTFALELRKHSASQRGSRRAARCVLPRRIEALGLRKHPTQSGTPGKDARANRRERESARSPRIICYACARHTHIPAASLTGRGRKGCQSPLVRARLSPRAELNRTRSAELNLIRFPEMQSSRESYNYALV